MKWAASARSDNNCILAADIDMAGLEWMPKSFSGTFDGQGHTISNLTFTNSSNTYTGFISLLNGTVKDLHITGATVTGTTELTGIDGSTGGIAGYMNDGDTTACYWSSGR